VDNNLSIFALGKSGHHTDGWIEDWLFGMGGMDGVEAQPSMVGLLRRHSNTNGSGANSNHSSNGAHSDGETGNNSTPHLSPGQPRFKPYGSSPLMSPTSSGSSESVVSPIHSRQAMQFPPSNALPTGQPSPHSRDAKSPLNGAQSPQAQQHILNTLQTQHMQQQAQQQQLQLLLQQQQLQQQLQQQQLQQNSTSPHQSRGMRHNSRNNQQYQPTGGNQQQNGQSLSVGPKRYVQSDPLSNASNTSPRDKQYASNGNGAGQYGQQAFHYGPQYPHSGNNYHPRGFSTSNPTNMPSHESSRERTHSHSSQSSSSFQDSSSGYFGSSEEELSGTFVVWL
jgi:hypothetical protein